MRYNRLIAGLQPSRSMVTMAEAKRMQAADPDILDLAGGEPNFATPVRVCEELFRQVRNGYTHYTVGPGLPELRERIAQKLHEENGCRYSADGVIVTPGAKYAIYLMTRTLVNPGDEVMYLTPAWVSYPAIIEAAGGVPVAVPLSYDTGYRITEEALERGYSERTKLLMINYPNNPTGRILTEQDKCVLRTFLQRHPDLFLLSDEIYERIVYDGGQNWSPASDEILRPRVITVNGFSKSLAMTGWRLGYCAADPGVAAQAGKLFQHTISCVSGFIQKAGIVALDCQTEIESMRQIYERRRHFFVDGLNAAPGVQCIAPEGTFYAWARFQIPGMDTEQICKFLLTQAKVVGMPGIAYEEAQQSCLRFSFAADDSVLQRAAENIARAMRTLTGTP